jgi:hypothetical protein
LWDKAALQSRRSRPPKGDHALQHICML